MGVSTITIMGVEFIILNLLKNTFGLSITIRTIGFPGFIVSISQPESSSGNNDFLRLIISLAEYLSDLTLVVLALSASIFVVRR